MLKKQENVKRILRIYSRFASLRGAGRRSNPVNSSFFWIASLKARNDGTLYYGFYWECEEIHFFTPFQLFTQKTELIVYQSHKFILKSIRNLKKNLCDYHYFTV